VHFTILEAITGWGCAEKGFSALLALALSRALADATPWRFLRWLNFERTTHHPVELIGVHVEFDDLFALGLRVHYGTIPCTMKKRKSFATGQFLGTQGDVIFCG
jgi:hypothetical protein